MLHEHSKPASRVSARFGLQMRHSQGIPLATRISTKRGWTNEYCLRVEYSFANRMFPRSSSGVSTVLASCSAESRMGDDARLVTRRIGGLRWEDVQLTVNHYQVDAVDALFEDTIVEKDRLEWLAGRCSASASPPSHVCACVF